ncbi:YbaB/EbfC DNA-binding family protein [Stackebrandtia albiflava]|uniref:YbaB/EbfC DNA-binding family protein n=1 Tax=Stackebrandtia albiflava TaxID=406432 RepID=A0A562V226_9ACTN|nr:YbaB/EbfC family nucleoid-associated protein [Stackebrandtia albiflava]TWJ11970.1 YbaB/EbfC DNA-binding family protein [Stackebrandtia albiflava]
MADPKITTLVNRLRRGHEPFVDPTHDRHPALVAELAKAHVDVSLPDGSVSCRMNATGELESLTFKPGLLRERSPATIAKAVTALIRRTEEVVEESIAMVRR